MRHFMPEAVARFLLKRRWIIRPGLESTDPIAAASRYVQTLASHGISMEGKRVLVFGYGGRFAVGAELLRQGAGHVVLCDHFVSLDRERNLELLPRYVNYLVKEDGEVKPRAECITLLHGDIREEGIQKQISQVDCVLSTSVYEHLDDVDGITRALANLTAPLGVHLHFVDLRDHYFKYPFEMLAYSNRVWEWFLNPTSNLNRFRLSDYRRIFDGCFQSVQIEVLERLEQEFQSARARIRPEFKTGDVSVDSVALIQVLASEPLRSRK
jgi:hypothetical protein